MSAFGPTFGSELAAAGVAGLPFSWLADGTIVDQGLTPEQLAQVQAVVAAHDPSRRPTRCATGKQLAEALGDLGKLAAWDAAVASSSKPMDRYYWLAAYGNLVPENNAKMARLATASGVSVAALFDKALTEPAV
jgi:hypothetical protein